MRPLVARWPEAEFETLLWSLACKVTTYRGVRGMLYRRRGDRITVLLVAPCPMTRPLAILADAWARELSATGPGLAWDLLVREAAPEDSAGYRCLFWRPA